jgi:alkylation response protein AidB-like acyl-CoA dehydrogenase
MVQHQIAEMFLELDAADPPLDRFSRRRRESGVDHGEHVGRQDRVGEVARGRVRQAGGRPRARRRRWRRDGRGNELERLYRDVRCGGFHPANAALTHETVAKALLGIDPDGPRW